MISFPFEKRQIIAKLLMPPLAIIVSVCIHSSEDYYSYNVSESQLCMFTMIKHNVRS